MVLHEACRDTNEGRWCARCNTRYPLTRYSRDVNRRGSGGYFPYCKSCQSQLSMVPQRKTDPLNGHVCSLCDTPIRGAGNRRFCSAFCKGRVTSLRKNYGLTVEQYRQLIADTSGMCPICREPTQSWHVDHDHATGLVTGVVCGACNIGALARTFHDPVFIRRLLDYVENPPAGRIQARATQTKPSNLHTIWQRTGPSPS